MKRIGIMIVGVVIASATMVAQGRQGPGAKQDPAKRAERMTERMVKEYSLNDSQKKQLYEVNLAMAEKMKDQPPMRSPNRRPGRGEGTCNCNCNCNKSPGEMGDKPMPGMEQMNKMSEEMQQTRDAYNEKIKGIFTKDQYSAFEKNRTEQQDKMKEKRGKREIKDNNIEKKP